MIEHKPHTHHLEDEKETGRLEAFSDGVFAIAITLLILDVKVPQPSELGQQTSLVTALANQWPVYLAFFASFFFILVLWINHHRLFTAIRRVDNNLMLLNGLLLLGITILPFPTALVSAYLPHQNSDQITALVVYNTVFFAISLFYNFLWHYASYKNRLFSSKTDPNLVAFISRQYAYGPLMYGFSFIVAFYSPPISLLLSLLFAVFFAIPNKAVLQLIDTERDTVEKG